MNRQTLSSHPRTQNKPGKSVSLNRSRSFYPWERTIHDAALCYYQSLRANGIRPAEAAQRAQKLYSKELTRKLDRGRETGRPGGTKRKGVWAGFLGTALLLLVVFAVSGFLTQVISDKLVASLAPGETPLPFSTAALSAQETSDKKGTPETQPTPLPQTPCPTPGDEAVSHQSLGRRQPAQYYFYYTQPADRRETLESVMGRLVRYFGTDCGIDIGDPRAVDQFVERILESNPGVSTSAQLPAIVKIPILRQGTQVSPAVSSPSGGDGQSALVASRGAGERVFSFSLGIQGDPAIQHNIRTFFENRPGCKILPGEEKSVNEYFGPYSTDRGMIMGPSNVGDGACNAASMLLYAAAESGLAVRATQQNHASPIPDVPSEYWVTIYDTQKDAWVRNPFEYPVEIRWQIEGDTIALWVEKETPPTPTPTTGIVVQNPEGQETPAATATAVVAVRQPSEWFDFLTNFFQSGSFLAPELAKSLPFAVDSELHALQIKPINITISPLLKQGVEAVIGRTIYLDQINFWIGEGLPSDQLLKLVRPEDKGYGEITTRHQNGLLGWPLAAVAWTMPTSNWRAALILHGNYNDADGSFNVSYLDTSGLPVPQLLIPKDLRGLGGQFAVIFFEMDEHNNIIRTYP